MAVEKVEIQILQKGAKKAAREQDALAKSIGKSVKSFAAMAVSLVALKKAYDGLSEPVKKASEFVTVTGAMEQQFDQFSSNYIKRLNEVSGGTISNYNLILSANKAMALGVTDNMEEMATLLEFARVRARAMGLTTTQAFNDLSIGIGRGSALILDNLGITIKGMIKNSDAMQGSSNQAIILAEVLKMAKEELGELGTLTNTTSENMLAFGASMENLKVQIGTAFLPLVDQILPKVNDFLDKFTESLKTGEQKAKEYAQSLNLSSAMIELAEITNQIRSQSHLYNVNLDIAKKHKQEMNAMRETLRQSKSDLRDIQVSEGIRSKEAKEQSNIIRYQEEKLSDMEMDWKGIVNSTTTAKDNLEDMKISQAALTEATSKMFSNLKDVINTELAGEDNQITLPVVLEPPGEIDDLVTEWETFFSNLGTQLDDQFAQSIAGGIARGLTDSKQTFEQFWKSIYKQLLSTAVYNLIIQLFSATTGGAGGFFANLLGGGGGTRSFIGSPSTTFTGDNIVSTLSTTNNLLRAQTAAIRNGNSQQYNNGGGRGINLEDLTQAVNRQNTRLRRRGDDGTGSSSTL